MWRGGVGEGDVGGGGDGGFEGGEALLCCWGALGLGHHSSATAVSSRDPHAFQGKPEEKEESAEPQ